VFPSCSSVSSAGVGSGCVINIVYNQQLPLCSSAASLTTDKEGNRICRRPEELCTADPNFKFDLSTGNDNDVRYCSLSVFLLIDYLMHPRHTYEYLSPTFFPPLPRALFLFSIQRTLQPSLCPSSLETQTLMASRTSSS
jgi:integrin alpha FG-GAP repeat containing protein 1